MRRNVTLTAMLAGVVAATSLGLAGSASGQSPSPQPLAPLVADSGAASQVPDRYIVVTQGAAPEVAEAARAAGGTIGLTYSTTLSGFSAELPEAAVTALRAHPRVKYVEAVHRRQAPEVDVRNEGPAKGQTSAPARTAAAAPWALDRIDQRTLPLDSRFAVANTGKGVNAYVIDSGIRATHQEFGGRVKSGFSAIKDGRGTNDCHGHGTFVASEVGGKTYGVAKDVTLHAVRILNCSNSGTTEQIVAGMDWTAKNHVAPAVANMSIQSDKGETSQAMDEAAAGLIDSGVVLVLIAGNWGDNRCTNSPKDPRAIITAASTRTDKRNSGRNPSSYGSCVTLFAPGADVSGAAIKNDTAVATGWNGTSMAAPLVTGTIANAQQSNPGLTMGQAKDLVVANSTKDVLTDIGTGSPNRLLYAGATGS
ncbi:S8 family peptidase [Streptomyces sp. NPDC046887]|uniref:S8 family peptidase n=1 Tax=Streptomyces sp. NPDC046887 TaxID=3155472 RepID=UPI0033EDF7B6